MKKGFFLRLLSLSLALITIVNGSQASSQKISELRQLSALSEDGVITLNKTGYNYYVLETPRPYDLVIFFTADDCKLCDLMYTELVAVAKFYKQANAQYPVRTPGARQRAVFFAKMRYLQETRDIYLGLNFNSVPNIIVTQPKIAQIDEIQRPVYLRDFTWQISNTDGQVTSQKILDFVNKRTNRNVEYREPMANMFIFLAFIIGVGVLGYKLFVLFPGFFLNTKIWFIGSLTIYAICMAGVVYNIIHDVPFTNIDRNGNFEWFHSGSRSQFGAEGFVMSIVIACIGLLLVLLQKFAKVSENENYIRVGSLVAILLVYYFVGFVEETYRKKSWYGPQFWPPEHYIKGPLMRDQGNNI